MKATIVHESRGRMRLRLNVPRLSVADADRLELWLAGHPEITDVKVFERTGGVIIRYNGERRTVLDEIARFNWDEARDTVSLPAQSTRAINRTFKEKLIGKVLSRVGCRLFLPAPLRMVRFVRHMVPFLWRGLCCLRHGQLKVELLDAISIGISAGRGDFGTAGTVIFLLEIGELLEDWTRKKSVADLARSMSLNVDRVWLRDENGTDMLVPVSRVQPAGWRRRRRRSHRQPGFSDWRIDPCAEACGQRYLRRHRCRRRRMSRSRQRSLRAKPLRPDRRHDRKKRASEEQQRSQSVEPG